MKQREQEIGHRTSVPHSVGFLSHTTKVRLKKAPELQDTFEKKLLNEPTTTENSSDTDSYNGWPLDLLCMYIIQQHHMYIDKQAPLIQRYLSRSRKFNEHNFSELAQMEELFNECVFKLKEIMKQKEMILFPRIIQMVD
jgi:iron-sulfur cluster repair protein YtfE (RIC family)